jgi:hypothetical protein
MGITKNRQRLGVVAAVAGLGLAAATASATGASASTAGATVAPAATTVNFSLVRSANAVTIGCLPNASARVAITPQGAVEKMTIVANGLPASTDFDLFVIQVPNAPFGLSWYQGDFETDASGHGSQTYVGRFSTETFTVAPGTAPAPVVHKSPIADASSNPATAPVHQFHLGLWFNSAADAAKAGCQNTVTPFNGEHNAGVQAMSSRNFADGAGPLRKVTP